MNFSACTNTKQSLLGLFLQDAMFFSLIICNTAQMQSVHVRNLKNSHTILMLDIMSVFFQFLGVTNSKYSETLAMKMQKECSSVSLLSILVPDTGY